MSKYGVFPGRYFHVFRLNTGKYGPEKNSLFEHFSRSELLQNFERVFYDFVDPRSFRNKGVAIDILYSLNLLVFEKVVLTVTILAVVITSKGEGVTAIEAIISGYGITV